ncbi:hypothetical protein [Leptospira jelokensis]|uniref:Uncharacterized protein n=1 Tax=Leptospira jelokensis TaxID=2484931 RepID=A0A4Z0ZW74_9LEPT|nr:hypothetical protein [Leptospira jelokensis]TGL58617.1 hypothetical protein EHQ62_17125 [Leptospira jelokensis]
MEETASQDKSIKKQTSTKSKLESIQEFLTKKELEKGAISERIRKYFYRIIDKNPNKSLEEVWREIYG